MQERRTGEFAIGEEAVGVRDAGALESVDGRAVETLERAGALGEQLVREVHVEHRARPAHSSSSMSVSTSVLRSCATPAHLPRLVCEATNEDEVEVRTVDTRQSTSIRYSSRAQAHASQHCLLASEHSLFG